MFSETDISMMQNALKLAALGRFSTSPNPRVGCVIAQGGQVVGQGFHIKAGEPHAEVHALRQAGEMAQGATAFVTLEPCSHYGRTPPCAEALVRAGVSRVVAAMRDPNPLVAGKGLALLEAAGIKTECGLLESEARELNRGFLSRIERRRPFVRLKCAVSLDGKTALSDGSSFWITGEDARADVQVLRAESCAVLTGIGTVLADNPRLNVRAFPTLRQPARIVLDSRLRLPPNSHLVTDGQSPTYIATLERNEDRLHPYREHAHIRILMPSETAGGKIDLHRLMRLLADEGYGEVMVEAGAKLTSAFLAEDLADEIVLYRSPKILGSGKDLFSLPENRAALSAPPLWTPVSTEILGHDVKTVFRKNGNAF
ncbi:TPA: bifunctional diaminohydroxyphosphoribosylaminopyrimidine deaminase/5-amino-6-(5-phosphoribosylamino)uracil reductase RibD [Neisseria meningitidis]|uniref:bifunctional diaminohydroxyphosphoribosylaminopyrimidine deaminase/5-amino-6-(5-phosphoribosylamino)uracil reductase RibD n=1 Tax=Neisseria TaxID=482 RepID=UPI000E0D1F81|nr:MULTISPECIES: bifunctional diaminohydroxyphosphoribosylaminopyrimidine deaminase/5-amino-6-(5-phosphoribosylamino)uracil reductase RibD [Neisseria]MBH2049647.1 bifunctional diaminohydroxyphosphoribosylaminopyrimidine deaminase/5-amino-6-(5-phosphoribosylamino)uracil reductase RibD [Neisseria meningitidis]MBH2083402.1 bifunctional diaminohydroxyphosphoribosylaminopyrimidine deaminase/5-amino-6-(5-phosphoribosylamino)uracil reductase RibD [Neisseria meningitidis]MBH2251049.1 bifunctional diamin